MICRVVYPVYAYDGSKEESHAHAEGEERAIILQGVESVEETRRSKQFQGPSQHRGQDILRPNANAVSGAVITLRLSAAAFLCTKLDGLLSIMTRKLQLWLRKTT